MRVRGWRAMLDTVNAIAGKRDSPLPRLLIEHGRRPGAKHDVSSGSSPKFSNTLKSKAATIVLKAPPERQIFSQYPMKNVMFL